MADYPISNVARRIVYTGSAGVGPYAFSFEVLTNTDINVYKNDTLLTLTTDYTVSISSTLGTGSVTLVSAATGSDRITIVGARALQRTTDFTTGGDFFANTVNDEMDSQTILVQQVAETAERAIKAPVTDPTNIDMTLPTNVERANKTLVFDADGNPTIGQLLGKYRGDWATGTAYIAYDFIIDPSDYNVYICNAPHTSSGSAPIETNADAAKWDLIIDAGIAGDAQVAAEAAQAAAELAETNAETAATNAASSAATALTRANSASTSATNAATSASSASSSASAASSSASAASTSASNASSSASAASTSASNASSSASSASSSASTATTQASNAATSATNAATSATAASTSASSAASSATAASGSASDAATSATNAANSYDAFDDRYLGAKSSAPSVDNDGNALLTGALYWSTANTALYVWDGSAWNQAAFDVSGSGVSSFNTRTGGVTLTSTDVTDALTFTPLGSSDIGVSVQAYDADLTSWAGKTAPSGVAVGTTDTQTLTNKRITSRVGSTTSSATPTINTDDVDMYGLTAQAADITSFTTNLSGTPVNGQKLWIYIVGTAARAITWGASFESSTATLPTTTVSTNRLDVGFVWNSAASVWRCVAVA